MPSPSDTWPLERNFEMLKEFLKNHCYGLVKVTFDPIGRRMDLDCTVCNGCARPCYETFKQ